ncbi:hypothetical protein WMF23_15065 [Sorangium sp. So ce542]
MFPPDGGEVRFAGQPVALRGPKDASRLGIATVYQDLALCDNLDVVANLFLGREEFDPISRAMDEERMERRALEVLRALRWGRSRWGSCWSCCSARSISRSARWAGIRVDAIRVAVFTLCGALAAAGGILATSRLLAVNQSSGGGDVLLNAIAAAVIGGTSLFGGRGTVWSALTGALLIGSISNGMDLLALPSSVKFMVTGAALLAAVTIDALARSGRQPAGRS